MRLTTVILILTIMQVSAASYAQRISFAQKNVTMAKVFSEIRKQTGYSIFFTAEELKGSDRINADFKNAALEDVLKKITKDRRLTYTIEDKVIIIRKKDSSFLDKISDVIQNLTKSIDVKGRITDENNAPLPGASIRVKKGKKSTISDADGNFELKDIDDNSILQISYTGYVLLETPVNADLGNIKLVKSDNKLDEVQVQAYGTTSQRLSTGNISTIKADDIAKQNVQNPLLALQGRVPGVTIEQATGYAGSGVKVRIQGQNSLNNGNDPLYVIDGVAYPSQMLPSINFLLGSSGGGSEDGNIPAGVGNPMSFINPADIESIDVLKDADATAIYGSRAANGAILITTKRGKAGETKVDVNVQQGYGQVPHKMDLLNTPQYLQMRKEAYANDGLAVPDKTTSPSSSNYDLTVWDQNRYTDWQKELIGKTAQYTTANASVSGGDANTQFLIGGGYFRQTTVVPGDFADQNGSIHMNINNTSKNKRFKIQADVKYLIDENHLPNIDLTEAALTLSPNAPALYNQDGTINWARIATTATDSTSTWRNPLADLNSVFSLKTKNLNGNATLSYHILPGLDVKSTFGYSDLQTKETSLDNLLEQAPELRPLYGNNGRVGVFGNGSVSTWQMEPQILYNKTLGKGKIDALLGTTILQTNQDYQSIIGLGYSSDLNVGDLSAASSLYPSLVIASKYRYNALFARFNYNYDDKYVLSLNARRDGSSRFGPESQVHNFGSVAGAWLFSNEDLIKEKLPFLSYGKLRSSYGTTGNDNIGNYLFMSLYSSRNLSNNYLGVTGLGADNLSNPGIQWEETRKFSSSLDLGFFKDRLVLHTEYYRNRSSNQLTPYALPYTTGFDHINLNFDAVVQNSGWEFSLNTVNVKNSQFSWSSNFNLTLGRNKLVSFPDLAISSAYDTYIIGRSVNIVKLYHFAGVSPVTGLYQFTKADGSLTSNPDKATDRTVVKDLIPKFYGGFQNTFSYKNFQLDFLFQFAKQEGYNYSYGIRPGSYSSSSSGLLAGANQPIYILDRWQESGNSAAVQKVSTLYGTDLKNAYNAYAGSDAALSDASYIRLKNVSLSWQLPSKWVAVPKLTSARLFVQGQNIFTITNYKGLDPETKSSTTLPPLRIITMGIQITL